MMGTVCGLAEVFGNLDQLITNIKCFMSAPENPELRFNSKIHAHQSHQKFKLELEVVPTYARCP